MVKKKTVKQFQEPKEDPVEEEQEVIDNSGPEITEEKQFFLDDQQEEFNPELKREQFGLPYPTGGKKKYRLLYLKYSEMRIEYRFQRDMEKLENQRKDALDRIESARGKIKAESDPKAKLENQIKKLEEKLKRLTKDTADSPSDKE